MNVPQVFQTRLLYPWLMSSLLNAGSQVSSDLLNSAPDKSLPHCITGCTAPSDLPWPSLPLSCKPCNYFHQPSVGAKHRHPD